MSKQEKIKGIDPAPDPIKDLRAERPADPDFDDIVKAIEKMVGAKGSAEGGKKAGNVMPTNPSHTQDPSRHANLPPKMSEKQAVETILSGATGDAPQPTMLEAVIRDMLPPLIEDWLDSNMERVVTQTMRRDALQEAIVKVWVENGKKQT